MADGLFKSNDKEDEQGDTAVFLIEKGEDNTPLYFYEVRMRVKNLMELRTNLQESNEFPNERQLEQRDLLFVLKERQYREITLNELAILETYLPLGSENETVVADEETKIGIPLKITLICRFLNDPPVSIYVGTQPIGREVTVIADRLWWAFPEEVMQQYEQLYVHQTPVLVLL